MSSTTPSWISRNRCGSESRGRVRMTPHSTSVGGRVPSPLTTPYPVVAVPGSMPRTITDGSRLRHLRHVHVEVGVDLLYVVQLFEAFEQLDQRLGVLSFDADRVLGNPDDLRARRRESLGIERRLH